MSVTAQDAQGELASELPSSQGSSEKQRRDKRPDGSKKRTKTGCMTCRRRRIKCDEQKPICNNCRKSRRDCDGYSSSTAFRTPYQGSGDGQHFAPRPEAAVHPQGIPAYPLNTAAPFAAIPAAGYQPSIPGLGPSIGAPTARTQHGSFSRPSQPSLPQLQTRHASLPQAHHLGREERPADDLSDIESYYDPGNSLAYQTGPIRISPILEQKHKHILDHFRVRLRPCISIYDKADSFDPTGGPGTTWGVALPTAAVSTPALAHAMIALSLQHMSSFGAADSRFARKHFWLSLKRSVELVTKKPFDVSTLATVLLLSWFNVLTGDHAEWDMHLRGASRLISQHDFAEMNRRVRRARFKARENLKQAWAVQSSDLSYNDYVRISDIPQGLLNDKDWEVNDQVVKDLSGLDMMYLTENTHVHNLAHERDLTDHTVSEIKVKFDLYWWYCKMDIFHGLLTGDPLLMPFETWNSCPPRGPMGDSDNISATLDHLLLIMGRLTDFGGRDRARKLKKAAQTGGKWVPVPGFFGPNRPPSAASSGPSSGSSPASAHNGSAEQSLPPSANEGRARRRQSGQPAVEKTGSPMFYGMIPPPSAPPQMHSLFTNMNTQLHEQSAPATSRVREEVFDDLTKATHAALANHKSISDALEAWRLMLPADFQPIPDLISVPESAPFGTAMRYSHPLIACVWAMYYLALIVLRRYHPFSPPAAMMSSGINAPFTRDSAQMIGKILAGLLMDLSQAARAGQILPIHYAALQEVTFPLMFAGVQYQDQAQRSWLIDKLLFIASESGWRTSYAAASACEKTWVAMGKQGKGPPYEMTVDRSAGPLASASPQRSPGSSIDPFDTSHDLESRLIGHDRDELDHQPSSRAYFATGLLAVEADMAKLSVGT